MERKEAEEKYRQFFKAVTSVFPLSKLSVENLREAPLDIFYDHVPSRNEIKRTIRDLFEEIVGLHNDLDEIIDSIVNARDNSIITKMCFDIDVTKEHYDLDDLWRKFRQAEDARVSAEMAESLREENARRLRKSQEAAALGKFYCSCCEVVKADFDDACDCTSL